MLSKDEQIRIVSAFADKVPNYKCPICDSTEFQFMNGYILIPLQEAPDKFSLSTPSGLPCIAIVCNQCGHVSFFNTINLGLSKSLDE